MSIFNSLGSNYSTGFTFRSLFSLGSNKSVDLFTKELASHYGGEATLTYKGREALELALKNLNLGESAAVGINGFTCYVVYRAVIRAGYKPVFIDINEKQLNFGIEELKMAYKEEPLKAVIVQNTLGYPADIKSLKSFCTEHKIQIIEDLAHSLGCIYETGQEAGSIGEAVMFSFSQDKPLDVVAGGALIDRGSATNNRPLGVSWSTRLVNRFYPFWTYLIRSTYSIQFGRVLHHLLKRPGLLANPMSDAGPGIHKMSKPAASLALTKWRSRKSEILHRQKIAKIYEDLIPDTIQLVSKSYGQPTYHRFPLYVKDRQSFVKAMKRNKIYIGDTWYDAPISPKKYMSDTDYINGQCPNAEDLAKHIVNLPTHRHVSEAGAKIIAERVISWQQSQ